MPFPRSNRIITTSVSATFAIALLVQSLVFGAVSLGQQVDQTSETVAAAADKAFKQGTKELAAGNHTGAITLLETAVRLNPDNAAHHHKLAKAYLAAEKYHLMWVQLRKATVLELSNKEYANDFLRMWQFHDLQGTLNAGVEPGTILKAMGEPDRRIEDGRMKRWAYGFMAVDFATRNDGKKGVHRVLDLRGYSAEAAEEVEMVSVNTDPKQWKVAHHQVSRTNDNLELTRPNEQIQQWTELFSKQRFPLMSQTGATVDGMLKSMQKSLTATDPKIEFTVLSQSPREVVYHWVTTDTKNNPAQHEVAKIIKGKKDFYRVAYVKKTKRLTDAELKKWTTVIGEAKLVPYSGPGSVTKSNPSTAKKAGTNKIDTKFHAWELGKSLAFAALIRGKHGPENAVKSTLIVVSENANALNVAVPAPEKLTDDVAADTAAAIHFLLEKAGKPIYNSLHEKHGDEHAALFELATKSSLLAMLYQPGDSTSDSFVEAIKRSAIKAKLESRVYQPLIDKIKAADTPDNIRSEIKQFQAQVANVVKGVENNEGGRNNE